MAEFNERYCIYEPDTNQVLKVCETKQEAISEVKFANVFRRMCGKSDLMVGRCELTQEELRVFTETSKDCTDCRNYWQNTDTENECNGQDKICHEFAEMEK